VYRLEAGVSIWRGSGGEGVDLVRGAAMGAEARRSGRAGATGEGPGGEREATSFLKSGAPGARSLSR